MGRLGGIPIGRYFGIPVYLHPTWFLVLLFFSIALSNSIGAEAGLGSVASFLLGLLTAVIVFITLLAHEYGHALMARYFGIPTARITLFLLGGVAQITAEPRKAVHELLIAIAGPAVSLLCMLLFGALYLIAGAVDAPMWLALPLAQIAALNLVFAVFNMLPGFPMDGGRVLRAFVWMVTDNFLTATRVAYYGGMSIGALLITAGIFTLPGGFMYILLGLFLMFLASAAYRDAKVKAAFDKLHVADLMRPVQAVVPAELSLRDVVRDYVYRVHGDRFPVVRGRVLLGYISAEDIGAIEQSRWETVQAERLARPYGRSEILSPEQDALEAFKRINQTGRPSLPVFRGRELIGYLFIQDVVSYMKRFRLV